MKNFIISILVVGIVINIIISMMPVEPIKERAHVSDVPSYISNLTYTEMLNDGIVESVCHIIDRQFVLTPGNINHYSMVTISFYDDDWYKDVTDEAKLCIYERLGVTGVDQQDIRSIGILAAYAFCK